GSRFLEMGTTRGFTLTQLDTDPERRRVFHSSPSREYPEHGVRNAAFSADGRYLACGSPEGVISLFRLSEKGKMPELQVRAPTGAELAGRPNAGDGLRQEDVPEVARAYVGGGDPKKAAAELVAVLGDSRFRTPGQYGPMAYSPDGKLLAVAGGG